MAGPNELGRVYVSVHAQTSAVGPEIKKEAEVIAAEAEKSAAFSGRASARGFADGMQKETKRVAPKVAGTLYRSIQRDLFKVTKAGRLIPVDPLLREAEHVGDEMGARVSRSLGRRITSGISDGIRNGMKGAGNIVSSIGASLGNVGSNGPLASPIGIAWIVGIPAVIGLVLTLATAIFNLLHGVVLLPGAFAMAAAAIVPMIFAFHGLGNAIAAAFSGNPKQLAAEIKKLTPAAGSFVKELAKLHPFLKQLERTAQQGFFSKIKGDITKAARALGPTFLKGFGQVTSAAGMLVHGILTLARDPAIKKFFSSLFAATSAVLLAFGPAFRAIFKGLAEVATAAMPALVSLLTQLAGWAKQWGESLSRAANDGTVKGFIDKFLLGLSQLKELIGAGLNLIGSLIGGPEQQNVANNTFDTIIEMINTMSSFFRSKTGEQGLHAMVVLAVLLAAAVVDIIIALTAVVSLIGKLSDFTSYAADQLLRYLEYLIRIKTINNVGGTVGSAVASALAGPGKGKLGKAPKHALGTISTHEHLAMISEGNKAEAVIPLTNPARARQLADQSGLTSMLGGGGDMVVVYIGDEQVKARVVRWAGGAVKGFAQSMKYGPRVVGVGA